MSWVGQELYCSAGNRVEAFEAVGVVLVVS